MTSYISMHKLYIYHDYILFVYVNWILIYRIWEWSKEYLCMASQRIGELDFSETGHSTHHVPYGIHHRINNPSSSLMY